MGDISAETLANIAAANSAHLAKPVKLSKLRRSVQRKLGVGDLVKHLADIHPAQPHSDGQAPLVYIVNDDAALREGLRDLLKTQDRLVDDAEPA